MLLILGRVYKRKWDALGGINGFLAGQVSRAWGINGFLAGQVSRAWVKYDLVLPLSLKLISINQHKGIQARFLLFYFLFCMVDLYHKISPFYNYLSENRHHVTNNSLF